MDRSLTTENKTDLHVILNGARRGGRSEEPRDEKTARYFLQFIKGSINLQPSRLPRPAEAGLAMTGEGATPLAG